MLDLHDLGRGRGGMAEALARITVPALVIGISSDTLYPPYQQRQIHEALVDQGGASTYVEVQSPHGHDGFLIEADQVGTAVAELLATVDKSEV